MRIAYVDMIGGASGDMLLGALVDCGVDIQAISAELAKLPVSGFTLSAEKVQRAGISSTRVSVVLSEDAPDHLTWADFDGWLDASSLDRETVSSCRRVFDTLIAAESAAHGVTPDEAHLHELGTLDTIVDVVGVVAGFRLLGAERVFASPFPLSLGTSRSSHGVMAATSAATAEIYRAKNAPVRAAGQHGPAGEAVTPTGAAIVATIASFEPVIFNARLSGHGAGARDPDDYPNVTGLWVGEMAPVTGAGAPEAGEGLRLLETNIDDMPAEVFGYAMEKLFDAGALDVWHTPVQMKKNRPGTVLSVLARARDAGELSAIILRETSTLGVRSYPVDRYEAEREERTVDTSLGPVRVKVKSLSGRPVSISPEYEDCRRLANETGRPLMQVMDLVRREAEAGIKIGYDD